jgi:glycosyltransferase involved in cell wall biosynthesis
MKNKLLLVTFPVDLGSTSYAQRLINTFKDNVDLKVYCFMPQTQEHRPKTSILKYASIIGKRLLGSYELQKEVWQARREGRKILFQGITPALFAYPAISPGSSYIVTDWTKKLYEPILGQVMSSVWQTFLHQRVINSQKYILCLTDAVLAEIAKDYQMPLNKLKKARVPFSYDLNLFIPSPDRLDEEVRILFVGSRFYYKRGHLLVSWFNNQRSSNIKLTILTKDFFNKFPNITIENTIEYGEEKHIQIFKNHDIFVLPTKCDAYPSVLGEAACAGLSILATKTALGAPEIIQNGVNGYICDSQEALFNQLTQLIKDKPLIESMKTNSREFMEHKFAFEPVLNDYLNCIFE